MKRKARCCCGQASIVLDGDPKIHAVCHCNDCKTRTGSAFGISAYFADTQIERKTGDMLVYEINNEETQQKRYFCSCCGTTLFWKMSRFPLIPNVANLTGVAGGCFVDDPLPDPTFTSNSENKCAWLTLQNLKSV